MKATKDTGRSWPDCIDLVKLNMHILPAEGRNLTPFEILYGRNFTVPDLQLKTKDQPDSVHDFAHYMRETFLTRECQDPNELPEDSVSPQQPPVQIGDLVFVKVIKRKSWNSPRPPGHSHHHQSRGEDCVDPPAPLQPVP